MVKDIKTFLRDSTQWSQLFLLLALIVVYLYNFKVLPAGSLSAADRDLENRGLLCEFGAWPVSC